MLIIISWIVKFFCAFIDNTKLQIIGETQSIGRMFFAEKRKNKVALLLAHLSRHPFGLVRACSPVMAEPCAPAASGQGVKVLPTGREKPQDGA
ncbi:MAG: hypothetical protein ILA34_00020 [Bacteroidaceae bacterium]|nr:hypothetical protein [Bacteroidaceae bacterium]